LALDDPLQAKVDRILHAGQLAANLISQLMIFSHKQIIEPEPLNLNEIVNNIDKLLRRIIGEHIYLETSITTHVWFITIDRSQLEQIIVNLAVNARDAMPGGGQLTIQTTNIIFDEKLRDRCLMQAPTGDYVLLAISDTGIGMSRAVQSQIFQPFFTTKGMGRGTGLGLATVYSIVKESGGDICVESAKGRGTTFKIYLPRGEAVEAPPSASTSPVVMMGNETILLVEDESSVRIPVSDILQMHGYHVLEARDGQEALNLAEQYGHTISLLITDVVMPGISGRTVVEQLSQNLSHLKILYISGYTHEEISHHGVLDTGIALLQKPFDFKTLLSKVRQVLDEPVGR
jgi:CheY-like chemotaxis protein